MFIDWVRSQGEESEGEIVELVINGDMVDFLAPDVAGEAKIWIGDETEAIGRLKNIVGHTPAPFEALRRLLACNRCSLTILLGNHDVELCLPAVRHYLQSEVLHSDGRGLKFLFNGEAHTCGRLLIEHGNRYDPWNQIAYSGLRQECSHRSRGLPILEDDRAQRWFNPPAGTLLVVHAINHLLGKYPFINLLKPETGAMLPLLLSLQPDLRPVLARIVALREIPARRRGARLVAAVIPADPAALGGEGDGEIDIGSLDAVLIAELGEVDARQFTAPEPEWFGGELGGGQDEQDMYKVLREYTADLCGKAQSLLTLGRTWLSTSAETRHAQVQIALKCLAEDKSWSINFETEPAYEEAACELVSSGRFSHVVFGHTHHPKKILLERYGRSPGCYLNAGAWADVIRLPIAASGEEVQAREMLEAFVRQIESGNLSGLLTRFCGYAEVELNESGDVLNAEIYSYGGPDRERLEPLTPITIS